MLDQGDITYARVREREQGASCRTRRTSTSRASAARRPYFTNYVQQQLIDRYGAGRVFGGGLRVRTTIDLNVQRFARQAITKWLTNPNGPVGGARRGRPARRQRAGDDRRQQLPQEPVQPRRAGRAAAGLVLQAVRARDRAQGRNLARLRRSSPGPCRSRSATRSGTSTTTRTPTSVGSRSRPRPQVSDNTVYAQLTQLVGPGAIVRTAKKLGITSPLKNYFAIGLGAEAVNPLEMARAFSAFDNGGAADRRRRLRQPPAGDLGRPERGRSNGRQQPAGSAGTS